MFERTGSATWLAVTTAVRVLPIVVLGPIGGVIADRYDRRRLIIASDLVRAALMVALAGVVAFELPVVLAPLLAGAATLAASVHPPAVAASTPRLVDAEHLQRANARAPRSARRRSWSVRRSARACSPSPHRRSRSSPTR